MGNAFTPGEADLSPELAALIARRARLLGPAYRLQYRRPLHLVRGEGVWLYDADGRAYLDAYNNVPSVGHGHPRVVEAIARQAGTLNTHTRYLHSTILDYSERLLATLPPALGHVMYTCSGSEANDLALRLAKAHTGNSGVLVTAWAYHGSTEAIAALSPSLGEGLDPVPHVVLIPAPTEGPGAEAAFAQGVREGLDRLAGRGIRPAALILDTAFTSDGYAFDPPGFLGEGVAAARAAGALFIADEVQAGFCRTGDAFWGFQRHGLVPDVVTMGKPMGNGHPLGGLAAAPEVVASFAAKVRYFNTFGGNPVSCAAGIAVLDVLRDEGLQDNAARTGAYLRRGITAIASRQSAIREVRGAGLAVGVSLATPALAAGVVNALRDRGVLTSLTGPRQDVLKIRPPLVFQPTHADRLIAALEASIAACV